MKVTVKKRDALQLFANLHGMVRQGAMSREKARKIMRRAEDEEQIFSSLGREQQKQREAQRSPIEFEFGDAPRKKTRTASPKLVRKFYRAIVRSQPGSNGYLTSDEDVRAHKAFQDLHDGFVFAKTLLGSRGYNPAGSRHWKRYAAMRDRLVNKILTTQSGGSGSGTGGDFIEDTLSSQLVPLFRQALLVSANLEHFDMPTSPFTLPLEGLDVNPYFVPEGTDELVGTHSVDVAPARTPPTGAVTFSAKKLKVRGNVSEEASEDAILSMVDYMRRKLAQSQAEGFEDVVINGDSTSTHQDSDVTTSTDHRKAFDGLRFLTDSTAKRDNGTGLLQVSEFLNLLVKFGKFTQNVNDVMAIVSPIGHTHLVGDPNVQTLEKVGPRATLLVGQVGTVFGRPLIVSGKVRENLNAAGNFDNSVTNRTIALLVHRPSFMVGDRKQVTLEAARDILTGKTVVVSTWRGHFRRVQAEVASPLARNVGIIHNINTTTTFT